MGVTICCKKTRRSIDMGMGGFLRLRRKVSDLVGEPWASHYRMLTDSSPVCKDDNWYEKFNQETLRLIKIRKVRIKTVDFLLQCDASGKIAPGACKQLLNIIGNYDDNILYGYAAHPNCARFRDFKAILQDCVDTKSYMIWS